MKDLQLLPALENVCSRDDLRPVLQHIFVTKEKFVATNAHIMVWHDTEKFFNEDFIKEIPDDGILIHHEDWKKMKICLHFEWHKGLVKINYTKKRPVIIEVTNEDKVGKYPNWETVIPKLEEPVQLSEIAVKPEYLVTIQKAINYGDSKVKMVFTGVGKAILVQEMDGEKPNGLIMPLSPN